MEAAKIAFGFCFRDGLPLSDCLLFRPGRRLTFSFPPSLRTFVCTGRLLAMLELVEETQDRFDWSIVTPRGHTPLAAAVMSSSIEYGNPARG